MLDGSSYFKNHQKLYHKQGPSQKVLDINKELYLYLFSIHDEFIQLINLGNYA